MTAIDSYWIPLEGGRKAELRLPSDLSAKERRWLLELLPVVLKLALDPPDEPSREDS